MSETSLNRRTLLALIVGGLFLLGASIYLPVAGDPPLREDEVSLQLLAAMPPGAALASQGDPDEARPLANIAAYALMSATGAPASVRVASAALHGVSACLVFWLLVLLLAPAGSDSSLSLLAPAAGALVFAVHPLASEALLSQGAFAIVLGVALALVAMILAALPAGEGKAGGGFTSGAVYLGALLCDASLWPAGFVAAALLSRSPEGAGARRGSYARSLFPYGIGLALFYLGWAAREWPGFRFGPVRTPWSFSEGAASQAAAFLTEMKLLLFPVGLSLDHGSAAYIGAWNLMAIAGGLLLLAGLAISVRVLAKRALSPLSVAVAWLALLHVHLLILPPADPITERRLYASLIAAGLAAGALAALIERMAGARVALAAAAIACVPLVFLSVQRARLWESPVEVWEAAAATNPASPRSHIALAGIYLARGDDAAALGQYELALSKAPRNAEIQTSIAEMYLKKGDYARAAAEASKAMDIDPGYLPAYLTAGNSFMLRDMPRDAFLAFNAALLVDEEDPSALYDMGVLLFREKRFAKAAQFLERASQHRPGDPDILFRLGLSLVNSGDLHGAVEVLRNCVQAEPGRIDARISLATVLTQVEQHEEAKSLLEGVVNLDPGNSKALNGLAVLASAANDWDGATQLFERASEADPNDLRILYNLAGAYEMKGDLQKAASTYEAFLERWRGPLDVSEDARARLERIEGRTPTDG